MDPFLVNLEALAAAYHLWAVIKVLLAVVARKRPAALGHLASVQDLVQVKGVVEVSARQLVRDPFLVLVRPLEAAEAM